MVNRKGIIGIVEAIIAILVIFGAMLVISANRSERIEQDLSLLVNPVLDELAQNVSLREEIIRNGANSILSVEEFFKTRVNNPALEYKVKICGIEDICNLETYPSKNADVYVSERLVSSTLSNFSPKKVRVFIWRR